MTSLRDQWFGYRPHGGCQYSDPRSNDRIVVDHHTSDVLSALERNLRHDLVLKKYIEK